MAKPDIYEGMKIIVDTREQKPYIFSGVLMENKALKTGDYSLLGATSKIAVERKSVDDFIGCTYGNNRDRFKRELERSKKLDYFFIIIEASYDDLKNGKYYSKINPKSVIGTICSWSIKYGCAFIFAGNRKNGRQLTFDLLKMYYKENIYAKEQENNQEKKITKKKKSKTDK